MMFSVAYSKNVVRQLEKLDKPTKLLIVSWIGKNLNGCKDPKARGKGLKGDKSGFWRYRIGDYRLICDIQQEKLVILALAVGHRKDIYKKVIPGKNDTKN